MSRLSNETIKRIALYSGFTTKEGGDIRSYVYEFARAIEKVAIDRVKKNPERWSVSFPSQLSGNSAERWSDTSELTRLKQAPLAQRKIQSIIDSGEYRVIENATVLVNKQGHAAIVNHGGAFYWVDNEELAREFNGAEAETEEKRK